MFNNKIHMRIKIVLLIVIGCFWLIIFKVFYIQVIDYKKLNSLANNLWSRSLVVVPNQIKNKDDVIRDLANILSVKEEKISEHVNKRSSVEIVHPEGRQLDYKIADKINELNYDGVYLLKEGKRFYPYNTLLSHSIGFVGIDNQGLSGLELKYDKYLTGASGAIKYYSDAKGNKLDKTQVYVEPVDGMDLYLIVNYNIQAAVERELNNVMVKYDADGAWAIVMDPNNGEILAISSKPDYDSNNYKNYSNEIINRNLAIWATYEPGSTFKNVLTK